MSRLAGSLAAATGSPGFAGRGKSAAPMTLREADGGRALTHTTRPFGIHVPRAVEFDGLRRTVRPIGRNGWYNPMLETALVAFTTFFATVGPPDVAAIFAALTTDQSAARRRRLALRATVIAAVILLAFALFGRSLLDTFGIGLPALRTAGGLLLFLIAIDLVFARESGGVSATAAETAEARERQDISVFPIAMPLIAGPGTIGATIVLIADSVNTGAAMVVVAMLLAVLIVTWLLMLIAPTVQRVLGVTGLHVISRIMGLLLAALAVQFVFDGIETSGLFGG